MQSCPVLLHNHACDYIFVGFLQLGEHLQDGLHDTSGPTVDLIVLIGIPSDCALHGLLDDLADIVDDE